MAFKPIVVCRDNADGSRQFLNYAGEWTNEYVNAEKYYVGQLAIDAAAKAIRLSDRDVCALKYGCRADVILRRFKPEVKQ